MPPAHVEVGTSIKNAVANKDILHSKKIAPVTKSNTGDQTSPILIFSLFEPWRNSNSKTGR